MTDKAAAGRPAPVISTIPLTEVDVYGTTVDPMGNVRRGIITTRQSFDYGGRSNSFMVAIDTSAFDSRPTFTFEIGPNGPRLYIHGTAGELANIIEIMDDGSIRIETHE